MRILLLALLLITTNTFAENAKQNPSTTCTETTCTKNGCWTTYHPQNHVKKENGRVKTDSIVLLNTDEVLKKNVTVKQIANLIEFVDKGLNTSVKNSQTNGDIRVHVSLYKNKLPTYQLSYHGNIDEEFLNTFYNQLNNNHYDLQTKTDTISFLILYTINKK